MSRSSLLFVLSAAATALGAVIAAQQPPTFNAGTRTVAIYATVSNAEGRLIPDLKREDFTVEDNGKVQPLTVFSNDIQPITVVMLLDRSGSMKRNYKLEQEAAASFVRAMGSADKARIGSFSTSVQIDPPEFTTDHAVMLKILENGLLSEGPTPLWNAVNVGITRLLHQQGRRVVLVFTDGVDEPMNFRSGNSSLKSVMRRAEEEDTMVYAIGLVPSVDGMLGGPRVARRGQFGAPGGVLLDRPDDGLPKIAAATGGGYFELKSTNDLSMTFARVVDELHHQYALGFNPTVLDGKLHSIEVHVAEAGASVRARQSYLARGDR